MRNTRNILYELETRYEVIKYYYTIVEIIENNVNSNPDISIESCKALIEGLSKFTLQNLNKSYDSIKLNKLSFQQLFKQSTFELTKHSLEFEEDFMNRANALVHLIGEKRNERGDISHGKLAPKEVKSDVFFSNLVMTMTDGLIFYWLSYFSSIEIFNPLKYEDNIDFNSYLDELYQFGKISYSKALFEQDLVSYKDGLDSFLESKI